MDLLPCQRPVIEPQLFNITPVIFEHFGIAAGLDVVPDLGTVHVIVLEWFTAEGGVQIVLLDVAFPTSPRFHGVVN